MEIKTTNDIIDDQFKKTLEVKSNITIVSHQPREDLDKYRYKKWVASNDLERLLKSCLRRKNLRDIKGNIKSILNALSKEDVKK